MNRYRTLEDFLTANPLTIDVLMSDGGSCNFPVKGREIQGVALFADIGGFSAKTKDMSSTETLAFVNHFFTWIAGEGFARFNGIIDKYIGDELMMIFSDEFGSTDPLVDALRTARAIGEFDPHGFNPHMGIASGIMTIGFVGTAMKFSASAYGAPVTVASRCAGKKEVSCPSIVLPMECYKKAPGNEVFKKTKETPLNDWVASKPRTVDLKNVGPVEIIEIANGEGVTSFTTNKDGTSSQCGDWVVEHLAQCRVDGRYEPRFEAKR